MEGEGWEILVRTTNSPVDRNSNSCLTVFHKLNLKKGNRGGVVHDVYPKVQMWAGAGKLLRAGRKIYLVGGLMADEPCNRERAAILDMDMNPKVWEYVQIPTFGRTFINDCAVLGTKIYSIANRGYIYPEADADDPNYGGVEFWEFVWTDELSNRRLIGPLVPDAANSRLLLKLDTGNQLYAYYPADRKFQLLSESVTSWASVAAVADDVLYVHEPYPEPPASRKLLNAFDLSKGGEALDVFWSCTVFQGIDFHLFEFHALLHVEKDIFWLATFDQQIKNRLYLIKFQVDRFHEVILCNPIAIRTPLLKSTAIPPYEFLLLQD